MDVSGSPLRTANIAMRPLFHQAKNAFIRPSVRRPPAGMHDSIISGSRPPSLLPTGRCVRVSIWLRATISHPVSCAGEPCPHEWHARIDVGLLKRKSSAHYLSMRSLLRYGEDVKQSQAWVASASITTAPRVDWPNPLEWLPPHRN